MSARHPWPCCLHCPKGKRSVAHEPETQPIHVAPCPDCTWECLDCGDLCVDYPVLAQHANEVHGPRPMGIRRLSAAPRSMMRRWDERPHVKRTAPVLATKEE